MTGSAGGCRQGQDSSDAFSENGEADAIMRLYQLQLIGLRRRCQPWQIPAVLRALQQQRDASLAAVRERRAASRFSDRERRQRERPLPSIIYG